MDAIQSRSVVSRGAARAAASTPPSPSSPAPDAVALSREERIGHFIDGLQQSGASLLRTTASVRIGQLIGVAAATPVAVSLAVAMGTHAPLWIGMAAGGAVGALSGLVVERLGKRRKGSAQSAGASAPTASSAPTSSTPVSTAPAASSAPASATPAVASAALAPSAPASAPRPRSVTGAVLGVINGLQSLPPFVYPSITGATEAQRALIEGALDAMPIRGVTSISALHVQPGLIPMGVSGLAWNSTGARHPILLDPDYVNDPGTANGLVWHEAGHTLDAAQGVGPHGSFISRIFGHGPHVSDYAHTNRFEDYAETHRVFMEDPQGLAHTNPEKYEAMQSVHSPTVGDLITDRPAVRSLGKSIGSALDGVPWLRTGLDFLLAMTGPLQARHGASRLEEGLALGDDARKFQGKMHIATSLFMLSGLPFAGLASATAHAILGEQVDKGGLGAARANRIATRMLAFAAGPLGMIALAAGKELQKAGVPLDGFAAPPAVEAPARPAAETPSPRDAKPRTEQPTVRAPLGVADKAVAAGRALKTAAGRIGGGLLSTVGGAAAGDFLGSAVGGSLCGPVGAGVGALIGRFAGGALGLGSWSAWRWVRGRRSEQGPTDLQAGDKKFLGKVVGGAAVGGIGGTILGGWAGHAAGAALGTAIAGPVGLIVGGAAGRLLGCMGGAYALARAGAWTGRQLDTASTR